MKSILTKAEFSRRIETAREIAKRKAEREQRRERERRLNIEYWYMSIAFVIYSPILLYHSYNVIIVAQTNISNMQFYL